jgi:lipopolysaccharide biosynthesis glycosyltransferase
VLNCTIVGMRLKSNKYTKMQNRRMNLIYMCVFHQESYIELLKLLIASISRKANINKETTDILIITSPAFQPIIQTELSSFDLPLRYYVLDLHTLMESSCCKLKIFNYEHVNTYEKILYLDTDVLVNSDVNLLFNVEISNEKVYAIEEGHIGHEFWGSMFFDFAKYDKNTPAFSAGVFYFMNSLSMKTLFKDTHSHIDIYMHETGLAPICLDQPFLIFNSFIQNKYDNQMMKSYLENNPSAASPLKIIYHFPGGPGNFSSKYDKMTSFWKKMTHIIADELQTTRLSFETRNEMMKYYCDQLTNPKVMEIGVFKGEFLDYIVKNCKVGSIEAVDLFEGDTCSGDMDGNNVVYYNVGRSYLELSDKYKDAPNIKLVKSDSRTHLKNQIDDIYDIIYIDGDHSYNGVKNDLLNAYNKIKNGGYIMGHDYEMNMKKARTAYDFGVKLAVDEFCVSYKQNILAKAYDGCVSFCIKIDKST